MILLRCEYVDYEGQAVLGLFPTDEESEAALNKIAGKTVAVKTERARSPNQHRMYFAVLKFVFENQDRFKSIDDLREATLIEIGYSQLRETLKGERYRVAKSIAFHNCPQEKFQDIFNASIDSWVEFFGHDHETLLGVR